MILELVMKSKKLSNLEMDINNKLIVRVVIVVAVFHQRIMR